MSSKSLCVNGLQKEKATKAALWGDDSFFKIQDLGEVLGPLQGCPWMELWGPSPSCLFSFFISLNMSALLSLTLLQWCHCLAAGPKVKELIIYGLKVSELGAKIKTFSIHYLLQSIFMVTKSWLTYFLVHRIWLKHCQFHPKPLTGSLK